MKVVNRMKADRVNLEHQTGDSEQLGAIAFAFLAGEPEYFSRFAAATGIDLADISELAGSRQFLSAVLEYLLGDEFLLLSFCEHNRLQPQQVQNAQMILAGDKGGY
ncbi:MAG TPA: DUF3572 family protein [Rhizobiales bacterium]|nr:DUF3572 family protein [Hyphomicrobiales bacterium]